LEARFTLLGSVQTTSELFNKQLIKDDVSAVTVKDAFGKTHWQDSPEGRKRELCHLFINQS